ncbi:MAG: hypothetical protein Q9M09_04320 [Mariprofundaceae bacterium]|nr:hypothetical protein [Mariprofundaceae bacterium]
MSVFLLRKRFSPPDIWQGIQPMFSLWIFLWPVYHSVAWIWVGLLLMICLVLATALVRTPFWRHLRSAWSGASPVMAGLPLPALSLNLALFVAVILFEQDMPEFGLGLALVASLAFPLARIADRLRWVAMPTRLHPGHTLVGHLALVLSAAILCAWSIHAYHGVDWLIIFPSTIAAAALGSLVRIVLPQWWNMPIAIAAMASLLWYL